MIIIKEKSEMKSEFEMTSLNGSLKELIQEMFRIIAGKYSIGLARPVERHAPSPRVAL